MSDTRIPPPPRMLFTLAGTPVQADISAPLNVIGTLGLCWVLVAQRYPARSWFMRLILTVIWTVLFMAVFAIHSLGHIFSARAVGAPMDTLLINAVHWVTLYHSSNVPPEAHIGRAVGGPLANLSAIVAGRVVRPVFPPGPFGRDLLDIFMAFNAFIGAAALMPTPSFDGGVLLKWAVYMQSGDVGQASRSVQEAGLTASAVLTALAAAALLVGRRIAGTILAAFGLVAALESLRRD